VRLASTTGRTKVLATVPESGAAAQEYQVFGTSITARFVYWALTQSADTPEVGELRRSARSRSREERSTLRVSPRTAGFAEDGRATYLVAPRSDAGCVLERFCPGSYDIHRVDSVAFERAPRIQLR
jgi:hypothetical protein